MDELKIKVPDSKQITIKLFNEVSQEWQTDEKGRKSLVDSKTAEGEPTYVRNDTISLTGILSRFDMRKYQPRYWKEVMTITKKLRQCYLDDSDELKLTESETEFLRDFLKNFPEKEGKETPLRQFDLPTYFYLLEQLGDN